MLQPTQVWGRLVLAVVASHLLLNISGAPAPAAIYTSAAAAGSWDCLTTASSLSRNEPSTQLCNNTAAGPSPRQAWLIDVNATDGSQIVDTYSRRCLMLPSCTNCRVLQETCSAGNPKSAAQRWTVEAAGGTEGEVHITITTPSGERQCLTRDEGEGRPAQVWNCDGTARQRWTVDAGPPVAGGCRTALDCDLNGECDAASGKCVCDAAWSGAHCAVLRLLPAPSEVATHALRLQGTSTWGGSVALSPTDGRYHMLAAIMEGNCGLNSYERNSAVVHAVSETPAGPYRLSAGNGTVVPAFAHNPTVVQAPNGSWVLYHIGCGMGERPIITGCRNGTTPVQPKERVDTGAAEAAVCPPSPSPVASVHRLGAVAYSCRGGYGDPPNVYVTEDLAKGQWRMQGLAVRTTAWMTHMDNPAPILHPNGSVLLLARKWAKTSSTIGVVHAPRWDADGGGGAADVYALPSVKLDFPHSVEDPYAWVDARGHYHAIFHSQYCVLHRPCPHAI